MNIKRIAIITLLSCIALGIACVIGLVIWRIAQPAASPQPSSIQPVSLFKSLPAQLLIGAFVLSILGGVASVGLWLFAAAPKHPDAKP